MPSPSLFVSGPLGHPYPPRQSLSCSFLLHNKHFPSWLTFPLDYISLQQQGLALIPVSSAQWVASSVGSSQTAQYFSFLFSETGTNTHTQTHTCFVHSVLFLWHNITSMHKQGWKISHNIDCNLKKNVVLFSESLEDSLWCLVAQASCSYLKVGSGKSWERDWGISTAAPLQRDTAGLFS